MTTVVIAREARQRAGQIRQGMRDYLKTLALIKQAWDERDWEALGYHDWQNYVDGEFSESRLQLSPEHRQKAVAELRMAGMSQRAIGSALGVDAATVNRDLRGVADATPERVNGHDGKQYAATRPAMPKGQDVADAIVASIDRQTAEPERPKPPAWDPEERRQHDEEVQRLRDIEAGRRYAASIVTDLRGAVVTIVSASRLGEAGLITTDMIRELLDAIELLKGEL